ncbi:MAG TPA: SRPBCC family protein [Bryobacteraceae bacterium]|nr:SRPBCC family protein [Bryobacteraceae bacterium]
MELQTNRRHAESRPDESQHSQEEQLANGLGWFSIGLGLAEVAAPRAVARLAGLENKGRTRTTLRFYGFRELAAGIGILSQPRPAGWMWGRVAGDLMDLASLGSALSSDDNNRAKVAAATAAVVAVMALDVRCGQQLSNGRDGGGMTKNSGTSVTKTVVIGRPPEEVHRFWRDFSNLPSFMKYLDSVQITGEGQSHWKTRALGGKTVEWDAELVEDEAPTRIAWRSLDGSEIHHSGSVRFERAPGGRGTLVRVEMQYVPPGGAVGASLAKLFGFAPGQQVAEDLRRLKQFMETGEVAKSDASIHRGMHAARPAE